MRAKKVKADLSSMDPEQLVDHQAISTHLRRSKTSGAFVWNLVFVAEVIALLGFWEMISGPLEVMNPKFLPPPSAIFEELCLWVRYCSGSRYDAWPPCGDNKDG